MILAAGKSTRLGDLALNLPKPMMAIRGKPIIEYNLLMCLHAGIMEVVINLHHNPEVIQNYLGDGSRFGIKIHYLFEPVLLGTSGAVHNAAKVLKDETFVVIYGDNYSGYDLSTILSSHLDSRRLMTIGLYKTEDASACGVAQLNANHIIEKFVEKPGCQIYLDNLVNSGIYVLEPQLLELIPEGFSDFGKDVIPHFLERGVEIHGVVMPHAVVPIDTPELLERSHSVGKSPFQKAVFLDRDGVINKLVFREAANFHDSPYEFSEIELIEGVAPAVKKLKDLGYRVIAITNQPGAAKGTVTLEKLYEINQRVLHNLETSGAPLDDCFVCIHHPKGTHPTLTKVCHCRKPESGLLIDAIKKYRIDPSESYFVGDNLTDIVAGNRIGVQTVLVGSKQVDHASADPLEKPVQSFQDLTAFATHLNSTQNLRIQ